MSVRAAPSVKMADYSDRDSDCEMLNTSDWEGAEDSDDDPGFQDPSSSDADEVPRNSGVNSYRILDQAAVSKLQKEAVDYVSSLVGCTPSDAHFIMIHFRWDKDRLAGVLADKGHSELYRLVGLPDPEATPAFSACQETCPICFDITMDQKNSTSMACGHTFCKECWRQHLKTGIMDGKARDLRCMAHKCSAPCDMDKVAQLLEGTPEGTKWNEAMLLSFVEDNGNARFCPSAPWCGHAALVDGDPYCEPECPCGTVFCMKCGRSPHSPCTCDMWDKWEDKISGDSETKNWIAANTKPCPKCGKLVEKNGGCNHVTCKCGQSMCWLCGAATGMAHTWTQISDHTCGRWKEELDRKQDEAARNHKRYMHYFERWKVHTDSHKKEKDNRVKLLHKVEQHIESGVDLRDYSWLVDALDQLKVARGVLAPSYVFAYFFFGQEMFKDDFTPEANQRNQNLFEDQQQQLEQEVERLSGLTLKCSESLTMDATERVTVINSTVNIQQRIIKFYGMVQECLDQLTKTSACIAKFSKARRTA